MVGRWIRRQSLKKWAPFAAVAIGLVLLFVFTVGRRDVTSNGDGSPAARFGEEQPNELTELSLSNAVRLDADDIDPTARGLEDTLMVVQDEQDGGDGGEGESGDDRDDSVEGKFGGDGESGDGESGEGESGDVDSEDAGDVTDMGDSGEEASPDTDSSDGAESDGPIDGDAGVASEASTQTGGEDQSPSKVEEAPSESVDDGDVRAAPVNGKQSAEMGAASENGGGTPASACGKGHGGSKFVRHRLGYLKDQSLWVATDGGRVPLDSTCVGARQSGVWLDLMFKSTTCEREEFSREEVLECVSGMPSKWLVIFGDSNSRRLFDHWGGVFLPVVEPGMPRPGQTFHGRHYEIIDVAVPDSGLTEGRHSDRDQYVLVDGDIVFKISLRFIQHPTRMRDILQRRWTPEQWNEIQAWKGAPYAPPDDLSPVEGLTPAQLASFTAGKYPDAVVFNAGLWLGYTGLQGFEAFDSFAKTFADIPSAMAMTSGGILSHPRFSDQAIAAEDAFVRAAGERHGFPVIDFREMVRPVLSSKICDGTHFSPHIYQNLVQLVAHQLCEKRPRACVS